MKNKEICRLNLTVVEESDGLHSTGSAKFEGNGVDLAAVLSCVFEALRIKPIMLPGLTAMAMEIMTCDHDRTIITLPADVWEGKD